MKFLRSFQILTFILFWGAGMLPAQEATEKENEEETSPGEAAKEIMQPQGQLDWPTEWTVFAPVERLEEVLPGEVLKTIPEKIMLPAFADLPDREIKARKFEVPPGTRFDLLPVFEEQSRDNTAYVFLELDSPKDQTVTDRKSVV